MNARCNVKMDKKSNWKVACKVKTRLRKYFTVLYRLCSGPNQKIFDRPPANYLQKTATETQEQNIFQMRRSATILEKNHLQT